MENDENEVQSGVPSGVVIAVFIIVAICFFLIGRGTKTTTTGDLTQNLNTADILNSPYNSPRIDSLEDEVDEIVKNLPLKEQCRVKYRNISLVGFITMENVIVPKECYPFLEKVQEHYKLP